MSWHTRAVASSRAVVGPGHGRPASPPAAPALCGLAPDAGVRPERDADACVAAAIACIRRCIVYGGLQRNDKALADLTHAVDLAPTSSECARYDNGDSSTLVGGMGMGTRA
jgi:hypothetical protein